MTGEEHAARVRIQRVLYFACGVGAMVFGALLANGASGFIAQQSQLVPVYWWASMAVALAVPVSFVVLAPWASMRVLHALAFVNVVGFLLAQLLWVPAMHDAHLANDATPWLQGVTALPSTVVAVLTRSTVAWVFPLIQGPIVVAVQLSSRHDAVREALLDGVGAWIFCSVLTGVALAVVQAADAQDQAAERAREQAALESRQRARDVEQARVNALVHDDIMSVLIAAGRDDGGTQVAARAGHALEAIDALDSSVGRNLVNITPPELVAGLSAATHEIAPHAQVDYSLGTTAHVPTTVERALLDALREALRNCILHAGADADVAVRVEVDGAGVRVTITDNGQGFHPHAVDGERLGIRLSIVGRMEAVEGGTASVKSAPGSGSVVNLSWRRP